MAALTLTTALANAQTVLNDRTQCLNENFELDKVLTHKATYEQLIAKINALNIPDSNKEKRRLLVIIKMTNPPIEQPKTLADFKKAVLKICLNGKESSPEEMAKQKQKELSLLLAAHEFMQLEKFQRAAKIKSNQNLKSLEFFLPKNITDDPNLFPLLVLHFQGHLKKHPESGRLAFYSFPADKTSAFYSKIKKYLTHPVQEIRQLAEHEFKSREMIENSYSKLADLFFGDCISFVRNNLYSDPDNHQILQEIFPDFTKLMECLLEGYRRLREGNHDVEFLKKRALINSDEVEALFQKKYQQLYTELQALQEKHFPKKEVFAKRFRNRLEDFFLPKSVKTASFPLPGNIPPLEKAFRLPKDKQLVVQDKKEAETPKPKKEKKASKPSASISAKSHKEKSEDPKPVINVETEAPVDSSSFIKGVLAKSTFPFHEIDYDKRVLEWFSKREAAPTNFTPEDAVWKHAFSRIVDRFLGTPYCFRDTWKNETTGNDDPCFCILADITFPNKETVGGVFQFTFDRNWVCYHRWFGPMSNIERLDKVISQRRDKIDFPPLRKPEKPKLEELDRTKFAIDPYFDSITFKDEVNGFTIKIYKVEE